MNAPCCVTARTLWSTTWLPAASELRPAVEYYLWNESPGGDLRQGCHPMVGSGGWKRLWLRKRIHPSSRKTLYFRSSLDTSNASSKITVSPSFTKGPTGLLNWTSFIFTQFLLVFCDEYNLTNTRCSIVIFAARKKGKILVAVLEQYLVFWIYIVKYTLADIGMNYRICLYRKCWCFEVITPVCVHYISCGVLHSVTIILNLQSYWMALSMTSTQQYF